MRLQNFILSGLLLGAMVPSFAEILLLSNGDNAMFKLQNSSARMPGIIIGFPVPSASTSPQISHHLQHAHAWSLYEQKNVETGAPLIFGGVNTVKDRQSAARANMARAQAFRLDFFK